MVIERNIYTKVYGIPHRFRKSFDSKQHYHSIGGAFSHFDSRILENPRVSPPHQDSGPLSSICFLGCFADQCTCEKNAMRPVMATGLMFTRIRMIIATRMKRLPMLIFEQFSDLLAQFAEVRPLVHVTRPTFLMT